MRSLRVCLLASLLLTLPAWGGQHKLPRCLVTAVGGDSIVDIAVERFQNYCSQVDLMHGSELPGSGHYDLSMIMGPPAGVPVLERAWASRERVGDSYVLKTLTVSPPAIAVSGADWRGTLFAAYRLMDLLGSSSTLQSLDLYARPEVPRRYLFASGTTFAGKYFRPMLFDRSIREAPRYGFNGVLLVPGDQCATPVGRDGLPISAEADGNIKLLHPRYEEWMEFLNGLKRFHYDVFLTLPTVVPPQFDTNRVKAYYAGQVNDPGLSEKLGPFAERYLESLLGQFPQIDGVILSSVEGGMYDGVPLFVGPSVEVAGDTKLVAERSAEVFKAYLDACARVERRTGKRMGFWTHRYGITSTGIRKMREVLLEHPGIIDVEDDYWPNSGWPMWPFFGYLPPDLRKRIGKENPLGLFMITTDGEYYGGAAMPTAYPDPAALGANYAAEHKAEMVLARVDLHDRTDFGTLFDMNEIVPMMSAAQLWTPKESPDQIWRTWANRRFGQEAASRLLPVIQSSKDLILGALTYQGMDIPEHSAIIAKSWATDAPSGRNRFALFSRPGKLLVDKRPGDVLLSTDYFSYEAGVRSGRIEDFRRRQSDARKLATTDLETIDSAKRYLSPVDYAYLRNAYQDFIVFSQALTLVGGAAYAANLAADNYDHVRDPEAMFNQAATEIEAFVAQLRHRSAPLFSPPLDQELPLIVENYRQFVKRHGANSENSAGRIH